MGAFILTLVHIPHHYPLLFVCTIISFARYFIFHCVMTVGFTAVNDEFMIGTYLYWYEPSHHGRHIFFSGGWASGLVQMGIYSDCACGIVKYYYFKFG